MTQPANRRLVTEDRFLVTEAEAAAAYDAVNSIASLSPNYAINGAFDIWQRGTSFSSPSNGTFVADRWAVRRDGTGFTSSATQYSLSSSELNSYGLNSALIYSVTTVGSSNTYNGIVNKIEDVRSLEGKTVTLSFWAKNVSGTSTITPTIQSYFGTGGSTQVFNAGSSISLTSSWARYSQTISVTSATGKTIGAGSYAGLILNFTAASTIQVAITGIQLEAGTVATDFRRNAPSLQAELAACQRYYYRSTSTSAYGVVGTGKVYSTYNANIYIPFPVTMRAVPGVVDWNGVTAPFQMEWGATSTTITAVSLNSFTNNNRVGSIDVGSGGSMTVANYVVLLANNNTNAYVGFSAEL